MKPYPKIRNLYKRDPTTKYKTLLMGEYTLPEFEYLKDNMWTFTEKVDGTNIRVMYQDGVLRFGGRSDNALIPAKLITRLSELFEPEREQLIKMFPDGVCLYGEGYGAGIQKVGGNYGQTQEFVLFDIKIGNWWLERHNVRDIGEELGLTVVPFVGDGNLDELVEFVKTGFNSNWGDFPAEGIVARPKIELAARNSDRIITKLKIKDFKE